MVGGQLRAWRGKKRSMLVFGWVKRLVGILIAASKRFVAVAAGDVRWHVAVAFGVTAMAGIALLATLLISSRRGSLKSPWSQRKRKHALSFQQWNSFFTSDGRLHDGGAKFLKKIRSGGVDPRIRAEVWPFLLGVYNLNSSEEERKATRTLKRKEYKKLRRQCQKLLKHNEAAQELKRYGEINNIGSPRFDESPRYDEDPESPGYGNVFSTRQSSSMDHASPEDDINLRVCSEISLSRLSTAGEEENQSGITGVDQSSGDAESSDSESSSENEPGSRPISFTLEGSMEADLKYCQTDSPKGEVNRPNKKLEDFATWQRIIRLDAIRANAEWVAYSRAQDAAVSKDKACRSAVAVGLKDYAHLEPYQIYHAARLVAVLEAYALYDPEIGYCQGMSDLLSPILAVMEEEDVAFWCFVGFMRKARHNFRLDEVGIRRQLSIVSKIIRCKDSHLYKHLEKLEAEDCFFVYRMVVVLFRRELSFDQTVCLWEVMWADQAAIRAGVGKSAWGRIRLRAPPTDDLLLYAIASCVLQRRKLIIERYNSMDEIMRECNSMAGQLDVWKLLDDAHDLVVTLHDKME